MEIKKLTDVLGANKEQTFPIQYYLKKSLSLDGCNMLCFDMF